MTGAERIEAMSEVCALAPACGARLHLCERGPRHAKLPLERNGDGGAPPFKFVDESLKAPLGRIPFAGGIEKVPEHEAPIAAPRGRGRKSFDRRLEIVHRISAGDAGERKMSPIKRAISLSPSRGERQC